MLYTRKGDKGTSGLFGTKERFPKDSSIYEALGSVDEINSLLGICRAFSGRPKDGIDIAQEILVVQECLFLVQAELAGAHKSITQNHVNDLEQAIERFENEIPSPHTFVVPGATELSSLCDYARAVSRRTERRVVHARSTIEDDTSAILPYLNRLSSFLYVIARYVAHIDDVRELSPSYE